MNDIEEGIIFGDPDSSETNPVEAAAGESGQPAKNEVKKRELPDDVEKSLRELQRSSLGHDGVWDFTGPADGLHNNSYD